MMKRVALALLAIGGLTFAVPRAQMRVVPVDEEPGHVALGLALRHLNNTGVFMMATAHPDDENNALLVMLNRGQGYRTTLATATRGNGGQNEIGPEIFEALGVLRTEELAAIHRFDGAEQYFTRAVDFGYSFSVDETFEKWGRDEILGDYVRLIRTIRPDVMTGLTPTGTGGGQHHQASAILAREAFKAAADPAKYPEQIKEGLRAAEVLFHRRLHWFARRCDAVEAADDQSDRIRPLARPHLRRGGHRSPEHAQVSGSGAVALAAWSVVHFVRPGRINASAKS
jgi:LmbE family N-acetylglucosaminyl deacetylase